MAIGSVGVQVVPDAKGFWLKFIAATRGDADAAGRQVGQEFARGVGSQGDQAGDEFSRKLRTRMQAALRSLPKAKLDADSTPADKQLQQLRANLARLTDKKVLLNLSDDAALATLRGFQAKLEQLARTSPDIRVRVDAEKASAELAALRTELGLVEQQAESGEFARRVRSSLEGALTSLPEVQVDANTSPAERRLQEIRARIAELSQADVTVDLTDSEARATLRSLEAELKAVGADSPSIQVKVDTARARAELESLRADIDAVSGSGASSWLKQQRDLHLLSTTLFALIPGTVQLGGVLAAAAGAAGLLGASGALAVLGINREMKAGTPIGQQYAADLSGLQDTLHGLEQSAASGFLGPFNAAVAQSRDQMRELNPEVHDFAAITGNIAGHVLSGLVGGLHTLNPLFSELAVLADHGAASFDRYANGGGLEKFQSFVQSSLPEVIDTLQQVALAAGHIIGAVGPLGGTSLTILRTFAEVINSLPVPVITALATAFIVLKTAGTGLSILSSVGQNLSKVSTLGQRLGGSGTGFAAGLTAVGGAAGIATFALAGLSLAMQQSAKEHQENVGYVNAFADSLRQSKGAIDDNVRSTAAGILTQNGWIKAAEKVGLSASTVTDAALGNKGAMDQVNTAFKNAGQGLSPFPGLINNLSEKFKFASEQYREYTDATTENNKALAQQNPALARQADSLGLTISALINAKSAVTDKKDADAAAAAVQKVLIAQNYQLMGTQQSLSQQFGLTTSQVQQYAAMVGITQDQVDAGTVSASDYRDAVTGIAGAENTATVSGSALLQAISQFSSSAGTAADRAALIGATLKAANGDTLAWTGAMNGSAVALAQVKQALDDGAKKTVDWSKGTIDFTKAAAQPLIAALQQMQDAAMGAASAEYQHELSTKGSKVAADDAYKTYVSQTRGALVDQAKQLGLTDAQATALANTYFGIKNSGDLKKQIEAVGADKVVDVLNRIGQLLADVTGHPWTTTVDSNTSSSKAKIAALQAQINAITQGRVPAINANTNAGKAKIAALQAEIDALKGQVIPITVAVQKAGLQALQRDPRNALVQASGGLVNYYANGALINSVRHNAEGHLAQIAPAGAMRIWAEPETGGEAYIPLAPGKRARSSAILAEVAARFGDSYRPARRYADGGVTTPAYVTAAAPNVNVTVLLDGKALDHRTRVLIDDQNAFAATLARMGGS